MSDARSYIDGLAARGRYHFTSEEARDIAPLIPAVPREGAMRDAGWKLDVNAKEEPAPGTVPSPANDHGSPESRAEGALDPRNDDKKALFRL